MAVLTTAKRDKLSSKTFGIPPKKGEAGKYPMPDRSHAANAKSRASEEFHKGRLSHRAEERIDAKANRILH